MSVLPKKSTDVGRFHEPRHQIPTIRPYQIAPWIYCSLGSIWWINAKGTEACMVLRKTNILADGEMFDLIHQMRSRIMTSSAFNGDRVLGAILFEMTMDREVEGTPAADYLWNTCGVVPFLKVDKGLADPENDTRVLKPMPDLDALLARAVEKNIFGTKMRSVIDGANDAGIAAVVDQQFDIGIQILGHGLIPIIEPEVTISIADKAEAEKILHEHILRRLNTLSDDQNVMLKLTLARGFKPICGFGRSPPRFACCCPIRRICNG
jgi:fructose-bisphosphate aldolase class 1